MKICAYVQESHAKQAYKNESFNVRQWVGLQVIVDSLQRAGYEIDYAGIATVHKYDIVLVSMTSDCDWWSFIEERVRWKAGKYTVICGGAGVLNVRPFLQFVDCFVLGRGEKLVVDIVCELQRGIKANNESIVWSDDFDIDTLYRIRQEDVYPYEVRLTNGRLFRENSMGCPHKCTFCGYSYHRRNVGNCDGFESGSGLWNRKEINREQALLDMDKTENYKLAHLRITAIDGMSERLRRMVAKPITNQSLVRLFDNMAEHSNPHQLKIYNIVGYPGETEDDWIEFLECLRGADKKHSKGKQWSIVLHCTPFRAMPATPSACWPMSYTNYRGKIAKALGNGKYKGNIFYQGNKFWAVEGMGTDSLPTVILSAIALRGTERDTENILRVACSKKFWAASSSVKQVTLESCFDVKSLFGEFNMNTLPTRNIRTYIPVEKGWGKTPWR